MKLVLGCASSLLMVLVPHVRAQQLLSEEVGGIASIDDVEITPDGRFAVAREHAGFVGGLSRALFYELATGQRVASLEIDGFPLTGPAQDAVAVTADRAVVLANGIGIFDVTGAVPTKLHDQGVGVWPRDVAVTPDGTLAVVRGGETAYGEVGGLYVFELATGAQVAYAPGEPRPYSGAFPLSFDVDSVVTDDRHAVTVSSAGGATRVTVWALRPPGGGLPHVVFETTPRNDQAGEPHDVTLVPGGRFAAVRSERTVGLYALRGGLSRQVWVQRLFGDPGPFGGSALDSIEATPDVVATISRWNDGPGAQLDLFTADGVHAWSRVAGDPHDFEITPDATRLVQRTSTGVFLFDLTSFVAGRIQPVDTALQPSTNTSFGAALDSVAVSDTRAVTLARTNRTTDVRVWDIASGQLVPVSHSVMPDRPLDVELTPDGTRAVLGGLTHVQVLDVGTGALLFDHDPTGATGWWPWCDGVAVSNERAVAFGYLDGVPPSPGWLSIVALDAPAP